MPRIRHLCVYYTAPSAKLQEQPSSFCTRHVKFAQVFLWKMHISSWEKNCNFRFSHCRLKSKKRAPCVVKCCSFRLRTHGLRLSFYLLYILLLLHQSGAGTSRPAGLSSRIADRRRSTSTRLRTPVSRTPSGTPEERPMLRAGRRVSVKPSRPASRIR